MFVISPSSKWVWSALATSLTVYFISGGKQGTATSTITASVSSPQSFFAVTSISCFPGSSLNLLFISPVFVLNSKLVFGLLSINREILFLSFTFLIKPSSWYNEFSEFISFTEIFNSGISHGALIITSRLYSSSPQIFFARIATTWLPGFSFKFAAIFLLLTSKTNEVLVLPSTSSVISFFDSTFWIEPISLWVKPLKLLSVMLNSTIGA